MEVTRIMKQQIRQHLLSGRSITIIEALRMYGCKCLPSCIRELSQDGMNIERCDIERISSITGQAIRFASYSLTKQTPKLLEGNK